MCHSAVGEQPGQHAGRAGGRHQPRRVRPGHLRRHGRGPPAGGGGGGGAGQGGHHHAARRVLAAAGAGHPPAAGAPHQPPRHRGVRPGGGQLRARKQRAAGPGVQAQAGGQLPGDRGQARLLQAAGQLRHGARGGRPLRGRAGGAAGAVRGGVPAGAR